MQKKDKKDKKDKILTEIHRRTTMPYHVVKKIYDKTHSYDAIFIIYKIASMHNLDIFEITDGWDINIDTRGDSE